MAQDVGAHHDLEYSQVVSNTPIPDNIVAKGAGGAEDTLLLLNFLKEMNIEDLKKKKVC